MLKPKRTVDNPRNIVIAGYFGFGNLGDELILTAMINGLRLLKPDLTIKVLSGDPGSTQKEHKVESIAWEDYPGIVQAISACDLVILGGGGLFHDYWGVDSDAILTSSHSGFSFYATIALLASIHKKKLMLSAVGVGPLFSDQARQLMKAIANQADRITVRDPDSYQQLITLGVPSDKITLTADAVFSLADIHPADFESHAASPILGVSLRHWDVGIDPEKWQHEVAAALDQFLDVNPSWQIKFIPFQNAIDAFLDDYAVSKTIKDALKNKARTSILPRNTKIADHQDSISQCNLFLGIRLHSIIIALMNGIPVVGIQYDPKVKHLLKQYNLEKNGVDIGNLGSSALFDLLEVNKTGAEAISRHIHKQTPEFIHQANQNHVRTLQLLDSGIARSDVHDEFTEVLSNSSLTLSLNLDLQRQLNFALEERYKLLALERTLEADKNAALINELGSLQQEFQQLRLKSKTQKQGLQNQNKIFSNELNEIRVELAHNLVELDNIKSSRGWKLIFKLWHLRLIVIPKGSKREALFRSIFTRDPQNEKPFFQRALRWLQRKLDPRLSWPALAFRTYKQKRDQFWPQDLKELDKNFEPGLVSIVLPVHNGERYVAKAIQRVLDQTYTKFELIIVDDGSTDGTPSILKEFEQKDQRIRLIHQTNLKLPGALNTGFGSAHGEFFTWTSDDNLMTPKYIEKMVGCLRRHPYWHMIYANMDLIDEAGTPLKHSDWYEGYQFPHHSEHIYLPTDPSELNVIANNFIGGAFMYRKLVADLLAGYSPFQFTREDYDYWMQVNSLFTLKHADFSEPVYKYRIHSTSLTSQDAALKITEDRKFLMTFEDFRRDFYLMPLIWVFEDDQFESAGTAQIKTCLQDRGQMVMMLSDLLRQTLPVKWIPCIRVKICETLEERKAFLSKSKSSLFSLVMVFTTGKTGAPFWEASLSSGQPIHTLTFSSSKIGPLLKTVDIKCRSLALRGIESQTWQLQPALHKISVVICTYNRNDLLEKSLRAIARQTIPQTDYEVIVVDNNPDYSALRPLIDNTRAQEFSCNPEALRLIQCPIKGLSYARNAGLSEATGEWILFLDDDALAETDLLEIYLAAIGKHPDAGVIGGHILLQRPEKLEMPWHPGWERYWSHFETDYQDYTTVSTWAEFPWGANWCARRLALFQIGGFRGAYGRRGEDYSGGEEIIAASMVQKLGYSIAILPQARVLHVVDPSRFSLLHLQHTILAGQMVRYQAELDQYLPRELSLPQYPVQWIQKLTTRLRKNSKDHAMDDSSKNLETAYLISAKWKLLRKQIVTVCARFKIFYPLLKRLL